MRDNPRGMEELPSYPYIKNVLFNFKAPGGWGYNKKDDSVICISSRYKWDMNCHRPNKCHICSFNPKEVEHEKRKD